MHTKMRAPSSTSSWASVLVHPLPLASVGVLALNDHLLKGSGLLPSWLTGKLSDFAGLFFFPMLLFVGARGAERLFSRTFPLSPQRLAMSSALLTGAVFCAVKLFPQANALIARVWGRMWMDPSDLWALSVLPLSLAFMLKRSQAGAHEKASIQSRPVRAAFEFAAVLLTGLASAATSPAPPPPQPPPPPPPVAVAAPAQVAADPSACASLSISACERSSSVSFVVIDVIGQGSGSCSVRVSQAMEIGFADSLTEADRLPSTLSVKEGEKATCSLSFFRHLVSDELSGNTRVRLAVRRAHDLLEAGEEEVELSSACKAR